jgi:hypothetical protein
MIAATAKFTPQADITAFELAGCMDTIKAYFLQIIIDREVFDELPDGVKRHFIITELEPPAGHPGDGGAE